MTVCSFQIWIWWRFHRTHLSYIKNHDSRNKKLLFWTDRLISISIGHGLYKPEVYKCKRNFMRSLSQLCKTRSKLLCREFCTLKGSSCTLTALLCELQRPRRKIMFMKSGDCKSLHRPLCLLRTFHLNSVVFRRWNCTLKWLLVKRVTA